MIQFEKIQVSGAVYYPKLRSLYERGSGKRLLLSKRGALLFEALALCKGMLVTNDMLIAIAYGRQGLRANLATLRSAMCRFRRRLKRFSNTIVVRHVRNYGYMLVTSETQAAKS